MKYLKVFLSVIVVIACSNPVQKNQDTANNSGNVQITFENISSVDFKNLTVAGKSLGKLNSQSSKTADFDSFGFDTGMPDEDVSIAINDTMINNFNRNFWCGTEKVRADSGHYNIKVDITGQHLAMYCENPPLISWQNEIYIRIENNSSSNFTDVLTVFPNDSIFYGDIQKNSFSSYYRVNEAYRYAYLELFAGEQKYVLQPIDYVGEKILEEGYYTYQLNLTGNTMYDITLTLIPD